MMKSWQALYENATRLLQESQEGFTCFRMVGSGNGTTGTGTTRHLNDYFRGMGYIEGEHYRYDSPYVLHVRNDLITHDLRRVLDASGARVAY